MFFNHIEAEERFADKLNRSEAATSLLFVSFPERGRNYAFQRIVK